MAKRLLNTEALAAKTDWTARYGDLGCESSAGGQEDSREGGLEPERGWVSPPEDASLDESALAGMGSGTRGLFITFEGLDGSGKSTQITRLAGALTAALYDVLTVREPGGTGVGEAVRRVLLDTEHRGMVPRAEALLYAAARAQLVEEVIRPALDEGRIVLSDRYIDSSLAYQGYGRGLTVEDVLMLNVWATECLFPDLTIALLVDDDTRAERADGEVDRLESEAASFFQRVAEGYRSLADEHPHRVRVVDGRGTVDEVHAAIVAVVEEEFGLFSAPAP